MSLQKHRKGIAWLLYAQYQRAPACILNSPTAPLSVALVPLPPFVTAMALPWGPWSSTAAQPSAAAAQLPSPLLEWFSQAHTEGPPWNTFLGVSIKLAWEGSKGMEELCKVGSGLGRETPEARMVLFPLKSCAPFPVHARQTCPPTNK